MFRLHAYCGSDSDSEISCEVGRRETQCVMILSVCSNPRTSILAHVLLIRSVASLLKKHICSTFLIVCSNTHSPSLDLWIIADCDSNAPFPSYSSLRGVVRLRIGGILDAKHNRPSKAFILSRRILTSLGSPSTDVQGSTSSIAICRSVNTSSF